MKTGKSDRESRITIKISIDEIYFRDCVTCEDQEGMSDGIHKHSMRTKISSFVPKRVYFISQ